MTIMETISRWKFALLTLLTVAIYVLYQRRGRTIEALKEEAEKQLIAQEIVKIREEAYGTTEDYNKAMEKYRRFKRIHNDKLIKYGLFSARNSKAEWDGH